MTGLFLIRHATTQDVDRALAGRAPGRRLSERGRDEARAVAALLATAPVAAVYASPLERTVETAEPLADVHGLETRPLEAFHEVDFGAWTGLRFEELDQREDWQRWNRYRADARPPGGESMQDVLARALDGVRSLMVRHPDAWVAVVSHCDVIRPLLAHFMGLPLGQLLRIEVSPASVSAVEVRTTGPRVLCVNRGAVPPWPHTP